MLTVERTEISNALNNVSNGTWLIPTFQRRFVWTKQQIYKLCESILKGYPIGMITVWEQPQGNPYTTWEPIKIKSFEYREFDELPAVTNFVLDGRQRLTALAHIFGGLRDTHGGSPYSGYWFIDLDVYSSGEDDAKEKAVVRLSKKEFESRGLSSIANQVCNALMPLENFENSSADFLAQINNPSVYPNGAYPSEETRNRRTSACKSTKKIINECQIAYSTIPKNVTLADVCEIFEVLNTTGTKVSTFDLIHNKLFASDNFDLRTRFDDGKQLPNLRALIHDDRPEFFNQLATACFIAKTGTTSSMTLKSGDLLKTEFNIYYELTENFNLLDEIVFEHNKYTFNTINPKLTKELPYPASILVYISLAWLYKTTSSNHLDKLNSLYPKFYWRNVLNGRYDQGFLTKVAKDIRMMKTAVEGDGGLHHLTNFDSLKIVDRDMIEGYLTNKDVSGAVDQALNIALYMNAPKDIKSGVEIRFSSDDKNLHHIFPKNWCKDNSSKFSDDQLDKVDTYVNLMPLTYSTNNEWKTKSPSTAMFMYNVNFKDSKDILFSLFIEQEEFLCLEKDDFESFWSGRVKKLTDFVWNLQN